MTFLEAAVLLATCLFAQKSPGVCLAPTTVADAHASRPAIELTGESTDVVLSAEAALAWDWKTGQILYQKNASERRPIASLNKLLAALAARAVLSPSATVEIPADVRPAQRAGANIRLPVGEHVTVDQLFKAGLVASAADAMVTLADAAKTTEPAFAAYENQYAQTIGLHDTLAANSTGLSTDAAHPQYSTANDVRMMLERIYADPLLAGYMGEAGGTLQTVEGTKREYKTTDKLLGTYLPILAGKTGFTDEAGGNLVIVTEGTAGQKIGAIILGSTDRFQDMKVLIEWINRNYTWNRL